MGIKQGMRSALGDADWIYQFASQFGLTDSSKRCRTAARRLGAKVSFRSSGTYVEFDEETVIFSVHERPLIVACRLENWTYFRTRLEFVQTKQGTPVADCRCNARYRLPCGDFVRLPDPPEPADFLSGYFRKGSPKPGDLVVDVGAFCGETTIELAHKVGASGKVFALEPDAANLGLLRANIAQTGLNNVEVIPAVLWSSGGKMAFIADGNGGSTLASIGDRQASKTATVEAITPAELMQRMGRMPNFIKMDIEGAEVEVLEAMKPYLREHPTRLAIASYHLRNGQRTADIITPQLESCGMNVETGYADHLTTWAWKK